MPWNSTWPNGTVSVADNTIPGQENTTYVETTMNVDHYWNIGGDEDGHHKFVQCPKTETGGTPSNPDVAAGMDGALYFKQKTAAESPDFQAVLPFFKDDETTPGIMEILGIRAMAVFSVAAGVVTPNYTHNVTVTRNTAGSFTGTFTTDLPSENYAILGGGVANVSGDTTKQLQLYPYAGTSLTNKTVGFFKFFTKVTNQIDPLQAWFICFGG